MTKAEFLAQLPSGEKIVIYFNRKKELKSYSQEKANELKRFIKKTAKPGKLFQVYLDEYGYRTSNGNYYWNH